MIKKLVIYFYGSTRYIAEMFVMLNLKRAYSAFSVILMNFQCIRAVAHTSRSTNHNQWQDDRMIYDMIVCYTIFIIIRYKLTGVVDRFTGSHWTWRQTHNELHWNCQGRHTHRSWHVIKFCFKTIQETGSCLLLRDCSLISDKLEDDGCDLELSA